ncbi:MarR family winged helix-turn-helix transcriptional regulator [Isoptericola sp. NEAU-Y5]|uniref:MarR family winged helix-turn-helix transcriptional regulator n=1 Tax=Isoptericola luteus TaxID=2879484 RepID=A0ABS7ZKE1_9MICO|nr:MarR family winged helix-turn-helix transcriptional regulator [Isoptericola sp. NEAU-Y5]MCA5894846.1 MarR family winged helix-turn-helix transcriptional regulator [Isoptericola sp. NEAU-Y5]
MTAARRRPPRLVFLVTAAERQIRRWIAGRGSAQTAASSGQAISAPAAGVLLHVANHPGATVGEVTAALQASPAGASGLLARMERADLVRRRTDPDDRRTVRLDLTPTGTAALDGVRAGLAELNDRLTDGFTADELATVARWLEHVTHTLR